MHTWEEKRKFAVMKKTAQEQLKLLFICLGNICRSPAAHAVMQHMVDAEGLHDHFMIDSAGIGAWHIGQLPDHRMREHGYRRGYHIDHRARQFDAETDFQHFDYIVVMDAENYRDICRQAHNADERQQVVCMADFMTAHPEANCVPDPYYGGPKDFEKALDLIEDGCRGLLHQWCKGTLHI